jgi:protein TonB
MKALPWLISMTAHGLLLLIGGLSLQQAIVGIAPGRNSIEVNLVASPSESTPVPVAAPEPQPEAPALPPIPIPLPPVAQTPPPMIDPNPSSEILPTLPPAAAFPSLSNASPEPFKPSQSPAKSSNEHKHNSQHNSGKDTITAQSLAGAIIDEEPDYLSNPAPIYPDAARDQDQEGVVTVDVIVATDGCAEIVKVTSSSGYHLLDESALEAVQHYRFRPAMLNGIKFRSHVKVPIRFRLDQ